MERLMSAFSFRASWGDSLNWVPSGETARDVDEDRPCLVSDDETALPASTSIWAASSGKWAAKPTL